MEDQIEVIVYIYFSIKYAFIGMPDFSNLEDTWFYSDIPGEWERISP